MKHMLLCVILIGILSVACTANRSDQAAINSPTITPTPTLRTWPSNPTDDLMDNQALRVAWKQFEALQNYRLAMPTDRNLSSEALRRLGWDGPQQGISYMPWWGARGYRGFSNKDFLVAIVVDP